MKLRFVLPFYYFSSNTSFLKLNTSYTAFALAMNAMQDNSEIVFN